MKILSQIPTALALLACGTTALPVFDELMAPSTPLKRAAQALQQVTNFGANTSGTKMYIYVPAKLADNPPIIVAIHYCTGTANAYYSGSPYAQLADQKGFIVIYPESPYSGTCWDVSSKQALTHNGGGDSNSIANMVTYTLDKYKGDATKVFVTGSSSGAMMTVSYNANYHLRRGLVNSTMLIRIECHGCDLPRDVCRRCCLLRRGGRVLPQPVWWNRPVEQLLRARTGHWYSRGLGEGKLSRPLPSIFTYHFTEG